MKEKCVEQRIVEAAESKIEGKYNLVQYKKEKNKMMAHRAVCQSVIAFSKENVHGHGGPRELVQSRGAGC